MASDMDQVNKYWASQYGITPEQWQAVQQQGQGGTTPIYGAPQYQGAGGQMQAPVIGAFNQGQANLGTLSLLKTLGLTGDGAGSRQAAPQNPMLDPSSATNPINAMSALGAAALGTGMVLNPTPGQGTMSKGGVNPIEKASVGTEVPGVPSQYANAPGVFAKAPMPQPSVPTGQVAFTPTPQATGAAYNPIATPFAQAPAAPGVDWTAHNSALENAGRAMFAHFGGDPNTANHQDIANFHSQLMAGIGGGGQTSGAATALAPAAQPTAPVKMATGGYVPGDPRDNTDSVPVWLSPGEYVVRKPPPETRPVTRPAQSQSSAQPPPAAPGASQTQNQQSGQQGGSVPSSNIDWNAITQPRQQQQAWNAMGTNAYQAPAGSSALTVGDVSKGAAIPGGGQTQSLGKLGGGATTSGAISGLASGLSAAAQAYADSIKPWQMQQSAIPDPDSFKRNPIAFSNQAGV